MGIQFRKAKMVLGFKEEKPSVFKAAQITLPVVKWATFIAECAQSCGVHTTQATAVANAFCNRLIHYMELGMAVKLGELGTFKPVFRSKTVEAVDNADAKTITRKTVRFYPGKGIKNMLNSVAVTAGPANLDCAEAQERG